MRYGDVLPEGFLPVYSTCCEARAEQLLAASCEWRVPDHGPGEGVGDYYARELVYDQTLDNLELFSTRLDENHDQLPPCGCGAGGDTDD